MSTQPPAPSVGFRRWGLWLVLALLGLMVLGGTVRITGSGLACPDWPGCYGSVFPTGDFGEFAGYQVYLEWSHRLVAAVLGLVVIGYAFAAWRRYRERRGLWAPAVLAVPLLGVQIVLGGLTVTEDLEALIVTAHLASAMLIVALTASSVLGAWEHRAVSAGDAEAGSSLAVDARSQARTFAWMAVGASVMVYAAVVIGSYVTHVGAEPNGGAGLGPGAAACGDSWPLCFGDLWPETNYAQWHMGHRFAVVVAGLTLGTAAFAATMLRPRSRGTTLALHGAAAVFLGQVMLGALMIWVNFDDWTRALHLALGTAVWTLTASGAVLASYRAGWIGGGGAAAESESEAGLSAASAEASGGLEGEQVHD